MLLLLLLPPPPARFFDSDCSGYLSFDELLVGLRGELNPRRRQMVALAFKVGGGRWEPRSLLG